MAPLIRTILCSVFMTATLFLLPEQSQAALPAYMEVEGETQGDIEGSVTIDPWVGTMEVTEYGHGVSVGVDDGGFVPGLKQHRPIRVTKPLDKASVNLSQAMVDREKLNRVTIDFVRPGPGGGEENYYRIELLNAYIVNISHSSQTRLPPDWEVITAPMLETLTLTYQKIIWTWVGEGRSSEDDWITPGN